MEKIRKELKVVPDVIRITETYSQRFLKKPSHLKIDLAHETQPGELQKILRVLKEHSAILEKIDSGVKLGNKQQDDIVEELQEMKDLLKRAHQEIERNSVSRFMTSVSLIFFAFSIVVLLAVFISGSFVLTSFHAFMLVIVSFAFLTMAKISKGIGNGPIENS